MGSIGCVLCEKFEGSGVILELEIWPLNFVCSVHRLQARRSFLLFLGNVVVVSRVGTPLQSP